LALKKKQPTYDMTSVETVSAMDLMGGGDSGSLLGKRMRVETENVQQPLEEDSTFSNSNGTTLTTTTTTPAEKKQKTSEAESSALTNTQTETESAQSQLPEKVVMEAVTPAVEEKMPVAVEAPGKSGLQLLQRVADLLPGQLAAKGLTTDGHEIQFRGRVVYKTGLNTFRGVSSYTGAAFESTSFWAVLLDQDGRACRVTFSKGCAEKCFAKLQMGAVCYVTNANLQQINTQQAFFQNMRPSLPAQLHAFELVLDSDSVCDVVVCGGEGGGGGGTNSILENWPRRAAPTTFGPLKNAAASLATLHQTHNYIQTHSSTASIQSYNAGGSSTPTPPAAAVSKMVSVVGKLAALGAATEITSRRNGPERKSFKRELLLMIFVDDFVSSSSTSSSSSSASSASPVPAYVTVTCWGAQFPLPDEQLVPGETLLLLEGVELGMYRNHLQLTAGASASFQVLPGSFSFSTSSSSSASPIVVPFNESSSSSSSSLSASASSPSSFEELLAAFRAAPVATAEQLQKQFSYFVFASSSSSLAGASAAAGKQQLPACPVFTLQQVVAENLGVQAEATVQIHDVQVGAIDTNSPLYYFACPQCRKKLDIRGGGGFAAGQPLQCASPQCLGKIIVNPVPTYNLSVTLIDPTQTALPRVRVFDRVAQALLGNLTAEQVRKTIDQINAASDTDPSLQSSYTGYLSQLVQQATNQNRRFTVLLKARTNTNPNSGISYLQYQLIKAEVAEASSTAAAPSAQSTQPAHVASPLLPTSSAPSSST
jgi:hypothetical protein